MEKESGVTYVPPSDYASSTSSDGPYVPTTQVIGSKSRRPLFTTKTAILLSLVTLLFAVGVCAVDKLSACWWRDKRAEHNPRAATARRHPGRADHGYGVEARPQPLRGIAPQRL